MSNKLVKCKACGEEIAKNAKTCPKCGAKNKKGNPILIGIISLIVLIIVVATGGSDDEPVKVNDKDTTKNEQKAENNTSNTENIQNEQKTENSISNTENTQNDPNVFKVGETASLKDVQVSFVGITESTGSQFNTPQDGYVFVLCEFNIENNSSKELAISSILSFEAYCDDYSTNMSFSALMERGDKPQLDGKVAPSKKFNGVIGYELPTDWNKLEIKYTPDIWFGKDITFIATK